MTTKELSDLMNRLLSLPKENEYVEFKVGNKDPEEIGKRLSALANGGALLEQKFAYLIFGINDDTYEVVGTDFRPSEAKKGNEELEHWLMQRLNPRIDFRIHEFQFQGKFIALFHIPTAQGQPVSFQHIDYIRIGSLTRALKDFPEKERKLWQKPSFAFELDYAKRGVSAAEIVELLDTQAVFRLLVKTRYPDRAITVIDRLEQEKLVVRSNGYFHITNLGALLFAKNLKDFGLERKGVRVIKYKGRGKIHTEKDRQEQDGYATGFEHMLNYVLALLPANEVIEIATRREVTMYPPLAVRELVANAIVHQDFREQGTYLTVEIFEGRIEISNPGLPIVEPIRFIDGYKARNSLLANAMRRMGLGEEKGSGIDKVIFESESFLLPAPDFRVSPNQTIAILYAYQDFTDINYPDKIRTVYQHACLMYIEDTFMTPQSLRKRFNASPQSSRAIARLIEQAIDKSLIKTENTYETDPKKIRYIPFWA
jgi:ATP-dependent DNA helicase RecG